MTYVVEDMKWKLWHVGCIAHELSVRSKCIVEKLTVDSYSREAQGSLLYS
jgi:hypothetical protein